jgi:hypothetical protein
LPSKTWLSQARALASPALASVTARSTMAVQSVTLTAATVASRYCFSTARGRRPGLALLPSTNLPSAPRSLMQHLTV